MSPIVVAIILSVLALSESLVLASALATYNETCASIEKAISPASQVYYPGFANYSGNFTTFDNYSSDIYHFMASSTQVAACSVEPGTTADVGAILNIIQSSHTPFAVRGAGHASNPGFSSTLGVHVAMTRFSNVTYDNKTQTATVGAGLNWGEVYDVLEPYNVTVVGGRVAGVGVAGFILGGGYSWKTNQYGLAIDNVQAFELVLPNGTVTVVTSDSNSDLFFGLRGGLNNFGIVTRFVLKTCPQTEIRGGQIIYPWTNVDQLIAAINKFSDTNTDPKAAMLPSFVFVGLAPTVNILFFYDDPILPPGMFGDFDPTGLALSSQSLATFVKTVPYNTTSGYRGTFSTVSVTNYSVDLLTFIKDQMIFYRSRGLLGSLFYNVEPFCSPLYSHSDIPSAYPPIRSQGFLPTNIYFAWTDPNLDKDYHDAINSTSAAIKARAIAGGQQVEHTPVYSNYATADTPLDQIYGDNLERLKKIKAMYDPQNVMGGAGGFKFNGSWANSTSAVNSTGSTANSTSSTNSTSSAKIMNSIPPFVITYLAVLSLIL